MNVAANNDHLSLSDKGNSLVRDLALKEGVLFDVVENHLPLQTPAIPGKTGEILGEVQQREIYGSSGKIPT